MSALRAVAATPAARPLAKRLHAGLGRLRGTPLPQLRHAKHGLVKRRLVAAVRCQLGAPSSGTFDDDGDGTGAFPAPAAPTKVCALLCVEIAAPAGLSSL